jgi:putative transposase
MPEAHWFLSLIGAERKIAAWREYDSEARPHSALQGMAPADFARQCVVGATSAHSEEPEISNFERS